MIVRYTRAARDDIAAIHDFIARDNLSAARQVVATIEQVTAQLSLFPQSGRRGSVKGTRELVIPGLPFIVVYHATDADVVIVAVFHMAQDRFGS